MHRVSRAAEPLRRLLALVACALLTAPAVAQFAGYEHEDESDDRPTCIEDLNNDLIVDTTDYARFLDLFPQPFPDNIRADLDRSGTVDTLDLGQMLAALGSTCPGADTAGAPPFQSDLIDGDHVSLVHVPTGQVIISQNGQDVWQDTGGAMYPALEPSVNMIRYGKGFDLVFTYNNTTSEWRSLGKLLVPGIRFGEQIVSHDFRFDGKAIDVRSDNQGISISGWYYPGGMYSPVAVLHDGNMVLGASIQYPILEYKHQVRIKLKARSNTTGFGWDLEFALNPTANDNKYSPDGDLAPGESRVYIVSVRMRTSGFNNWWRVLMPYRNFFNTLYGPVEYQRDNSPVQYNSLAVDGNSGWLNPYAFAGGDNLRPDIHGFGPWVDRLVDRIDRGYSRIMVSKPTGHFFANPQNNIPPMYTSHWLEGGMYDHNMGDAVEQFNRIPGVGLTLGLWQGRSAQVMLDGWDTPGIEELNVNDPEHVAFGLREIDTAYAAGARLIGLDAFRRMQAWDALEWVRTLQDRAPGTKFVTEPVCGDVLHRVVPAFQVATRPLNEADLRVETRHYLADFINPGHELWGHIREDRLEDYLGHEPSDEDFAEEARRVAALGYIPSITRPVAVEPGFFAVESWRLNTP